MREERDLFKRECYLLMRKVITCGVAAAHPDANLARTGVYADAWSPQAEQVCELRAAKEAAEKERESYRRDRNEWRSLCHSLQKR